MSGRGPPPVTRGCVLYAQHDHVREKLNGLALYNHALSTGPDEVLVTLRELEDAGVISEIRIEVIR